MTSNDALNYEICWVHISDIHETGEPGAEDQHRKLIFQRLLEDLIDVLRSVRLIPI